jgi:prepilin-type N-terminal cleavage/methylation domain-containing protein
MRKLRAFTLVELLVVIGIIALLVSILLPTLSSARRQSNSVKCLSNLRQLGNAFMLYSNENRGFWPIAADDNTGRRWADLIASYIAAGQFNTSTDITAARENSVLWGCPEWYKIMEYSPTRTADKVRPGYGMNMYNSWFETPGLKVVPYLYVKGDPNYKPGDYLRQSQWTKSAERMLLADSITHVIDCPTTFGPTNPIMPYDYSMFSTSGIPANTFYVDASRHLKNGTSKAQAYNQKGINELFCDGHAAPVSPAEAWNSIHNPGENRAGN